MQQRLNQSIDTTNVERPGKAAVTRFFNEHFDAYETLQNQPKKVGPGVLAALGKDSVDWQEKWTIMCRHFDIMHWWESTGKVLHPHVYPVACCILAMADSNGHQERTFSAATWMDGKLKRRQKDFTFQSKVLLHKNKDFLAAHEEFLKQDMVKAVIARAEERTRVQIAKILEGCTDSDMDEELEAEFDAHVNPEDSD